MSAPVQYLIHSLIVVSWRELVQAQDVSKAIVHVVEVIRGNVLVMHPKGMLRRPKWQAQLFHREKQSNSSLYVTPIG